MACQYEAEIRAAAIRYGINPDIAVAQATQESGCRPTVCSSQGACGLMQFLPGTAAQYGVTDRNNVQQSLDGWGRYMRDLLAHFGGNYSLALAGYHSGQGSAQAALNNCAGNPKTCNYVNTILGNAQPAAQGAEPGGFDLSGITGGISTPMLIGIIVGAFVLLRR